MKAVVERQEVLNGLKVVHTVINNSRVNLGSKFLNIVTIGKDVYFLGLGKQRLVGYKIGKLEEEVSPMIYNIKYGKLSQPLHTLGQSVGEQLTFVFEEGKVVIQAQNVTLHLLSYTGESLTDEIEMIKTLKEGSKYPRKDYLEVLSTFNSMIKNPNSSVIVTNTGYSYTQDDNLMVSRLKFDFDKDHVLDMSSVKTIIEELKTSDDEDISVTIDSEKEQYILRSGNAFYILSGASTYYTEELLELFDNFEVENTLTFNYKDFVKYLKLSQIYLENSDDAVLDYSNGKLSIIPANAYEEEGLVNNETSYSDVVMEAQGDENLESIVVSIPLVKVLNTLGVLSDLTDLKELVFELSDDESNAGHFKHEKGDMLLGINILD